MKLDDIIQLLSDEGDRIIREMSDRLGTAGKGGGTLDDSLSWEVLGDDTRVRLQISMAEHGIYVDQGRRPGKQPPLSNIREWCSSKGIPQDAAYPIARHIGRFGIPPTRFATIPLEAAESRIAAKLEEVVESVIENSIDVIIGE